MHNPPTATTTYSISSLVAFDDWLRNINLTRVTGFRYRKRGLIDTVNVFGRLYITREEIARFEKRAIAGEFHRTVIPPARRPITSCSADNGGGSLPDAASGAEQEVQK